MNEEIKIEAENEEQKYGHDKSATINRTYIESGEFRRKFDHITESKTMNRLLYQLAKKALLHRTSTLFEDMYWIDVDTEKVFAEETSANEIEKINYSAATYKAITEHQNIITIHSHPNSCPPSIEDFNSNALNNYFLGIVVCHDGTIYKYSSNQKIDNRYYALKVAQYLKNGYTEIEAQKRTIIGLQEKFDIECKEVKDDGDRE